MDLSSASIFCTGGAGTLGKAIAARRKLEGWTGKFTVYSTSEHNHALMRRFFPDINYVCGDIRNPESLYNAMVGHDLVIHAAAVKHIPVSEENCLDTYDVNVNGSVNVFSQSIRANIPHVIAISTDKAAHPCNAYGCSKMMMEKVCQEYSRLPLGTAFHLARYGNVIESSGSVIEAWKRAVSEGRKIKITDPSMTRFWLSPAQAVDLVLDALDLENGHIYVAKMPALSIGRMADYALGEGSYEFERIPLRPGEKMHETLLTTEETDYTVDCGSYFDVRPSVEERNGHGWVTKKGSWSQLNGYDPYSSDMAPELTQEQFDKIIEDV